MPKQNLGKVALTPKGAFNLETQYEKNDIVTMGGSSYLAKQATIGNLVTDTFYWMLLASKGDRGLPGEVGMEEFNALAERIATVENRLDSLLDATGEVF